MSEDDAHAANAPQPASHVARASPAQPGGRSVSSTELLGAGRELTIEHNGEIYSLRLTSKGKLILTK